MSKTLDQTAASSENIEPIKARLKKIKENPKNAKKHWYIYLRYIFQYRVDLHYYLKISF